MIDESHKTVPQIGGMYHGDQSRKSTLVDYGFRLPSALDNRPLSLTNLKVRFDQVMFVSATPGKYEEEQELLKSRAGNPSDRSSRSGSGSSSGEGQIDDLIGEVNKEIAKSTKY